MNYELPTLFNRKFINFALMDVSAALQKLSTDLSPDEKLNIRKELSAYLNYLLVNDFSALVQVLYRVDVSEQKIKKVLQENKEADAGDLLAELLLERQVQKQSVRTTPPPAEDIPDEERW